MSASKLDAIFNPKSIAVVGASTKPGTVGNDQPRTKTFVSEVCHTK